MEPIGDVPPAEFEAARPVGGPGYPSDSPGRASGEPGAVQILARQRTADHEASIAPWKGVNQTLKDANRTVVGSASRSRLRSHGDPLGEALLARLPGGYDRDVPWGRAAWNEGIYPTHPTTSAHNPTLPPRPRNDAERGSWLPGLFLSFSASSVASRS